MGHNDATAPPPFDRTAYVAAIRTLHRTIQSVGVTNGVYKGHGRVGGVLKATSTDPWSASFMVETRMLFIFHKSKNSTSDYEIQMPPTVPVRCTDIRWSTHAPQYCCHHRANDIVHQHDQSLEWLANHSKGTLPDIRNLVMESLATPPKRFLALRPTMPGEFDIVRDP
ncbi:hypothetical protein GQ457_17G007740 [Hibiscus cannabinus]